MEFDFSAEVADIAAVPESFRPMYAKDEASGKFKLVDHAGVKSAAEALSGMGKALKAARADAKASKDKAIDLTPLADFGKTPEEIKAAIEAKIQEATAAAKGTDAEKFRKDLEKIKADLSANFGKETEKREARIKALSGQLEKILVDNAIVSAASADAVDVELLMPHIRNRVKVGEENGEFRVYVVDSDGTERHSITGQPMTIAELVKEMKGSQKFAPLFKSEAKGGSGASAGASAGKGLPAGAKLSSIEKIKRGLAAREAGR